MLRYFISQVVILKRALDCIARLKHYYLHGAWRCRRTSSLEASMMITRAELEQF